MTDQPSRFSKILQLEDPASLLQKSKSPTKQNQKIHKSRSNIDHHREYFGNDTLCYPRGLCRKMTNFATSAASVGKWRILLGEGQLENDECGRGKACRKMMNFARRESVLCPRCPPRVPKNRNGQKVVRDWFWAFPNDMPKKLSKSCQKRVPAKTGTMKTRI